MNIQALIVDDEKDARDALRILINKFVPHVTIVGEADSVKSGIREIESLHPQLVFLDINMLDGTGFDLLDQLDLVNFHLVFVTAYDQYAIKAFKYAAIDYLLKPIDLQELRKCVARIEQAGQRKKEGRSLDSLTSSHLIQEVRAAILEKEQSFKKRFTIKKQSGIFLLHTADIAYFFADDNLVFAMDQDARKHVVSHRISELEEILDPNTFFKINRSEIVNIHFIQKMEAYFGNRLVIVMKGGTGELTTSASKTATFRKWLDR
ncbi:MAG: LytTR family DNA-binding domain-containing protein [Bacteroidota bacterium]